MARTLVTRVEQFDPCWGCGCTLSRPCTGGCRRDPFYHRRTIGLCSSCISREVALKRFGGSKKHTERHNQPSQQQIEQLGGWRCVICEHSEELGFYDRDRGGTFDRMIDWFHHADERRWLGGLCAVTPAGNPSKVYGCRPALMRVARGTRHGSVRRLRALKTYNDARSRFSAVAGSRPSTADHRIARRLRADGIQVTAAEVASYRDAAGDQCAVCHRNHWEPWERRRNPLGLDHDHAGKRIRGWLCAECNGGMQFIDLAEPTERETYYRRALWLFRDAQGPAGDPWYITSPWFRTRSLN